MRNRLCALIACLIAVGAWPVSAQEKATSKQKLVEMRKTVEGLKWDKVDFAALSPLERCRTLMLLNHALDELDDAAVAEADLAGAFVEQQNLNESYASFLGSEAPLARSYDDARKIASALLKGPMSGSRYATELSDSDARGLAASEKAYDTTARRRWESFSNTSRVLRKMVAFLKDKGKIKEYMTWVPTETARLQDEYEPSSAAQPATTTPPPPGAKKPAAPTPTGEPEQQQQNRADSQQAQQALIAAQQTAPTTVVVENDDDWYPGWYNGAIDNMKRARPVHRNSEYQAAARTRVEQREKTGQKPAPPKAGGGGRRP